MAGALAQGGRAQVMGGARHLDEPLQEVVRRLNRRQHKSPDVFSQTRSAANVAVLWPQSTTDFGGTRQKMLGTDAGAFWGARVGRVFRLGGSSLPGVRYHLVKARLCRRSVADGPGPRRPAHAGTSSASRSSSCGPRFPQPIANTATGFHETECCWIVKRLRLQ
jgi:hypothetical protein